MASYGIIQWSAPTTGGSDIVDIVFIHGLRGTATGTWTATGQDQAWPQALLAKDLANANIKANIMAFGYDADIVNVTGEPAGQNRIEQHARNLLGDLHSERMIAGTEEKPLIFVCHSLGGLVVKNALNLSARSPEPHIKAIVEHTKGVIFMGTPHLGADAAKFARFLSNFARAFRLTMTDIVRVLERDSEVLAIITSEFHEMLRVRAQEGKKEIQLVCFVEEQAMQRFGVSHTIVDRQSAHIPGFQVYSIHADHVGMTKFQTETENGYRQVKTQLFMLARPTGRPAPEVTPNEATRERWTRGTRSGIIQTGNTSVSTSTLSSGGGPITVGSQMSFH